jgi:hypothetical protein
VRRRASSHQAGNARLAYLSSAAVTDKHELEGGHAALCGSLSHGCDLLWWRGGACLLSSARRLARISVSACRMCGEAMLDGVVVPAYLW